jgi:hypothetical protein
MSKFTMLIATTMLVATTAASNADRLPYFGGEPYNGSYLNGPLADYRYSARWASNRGYDAYALGSCKTWRARHVTANGHVVDRTRQTCS